MNSADHLDGKLPVFVFPTTLNFYVDDPTSHKQILTLYNPYEFTVLFKVLCNNPTKYNVVETEGLIKSKCCIDIVVRVIEYQQVVRREDKFRIHLYEHGLPKLLGKKDILAVVLCNRATYSIKDGSKERRPKIKEVDEMFQQHRRESVVVQRSLPSLHVVVLLLACLLVLMLPTQGDEANTNIPKYLYLSVNQKLIAAFILGLVTMAVLKP